MTLDVANSPTMEDEPTPVSPNGDGWHRICRGNFVPLSGAMLILIVGEFVSMKLSIYEEYVPASCSCSISTYGRR